MGINLSCSAAWLRAAVVLATLCGEASQSALANGQLEELAQRVGVRILAEGTSDRELLEETQKRIPYSRMSQSAQHRANEIISNVSQFRRMPSLQYRVNPDIYQYLISHPDVAVSTWRVMGISQLEMRQTGDFTYEASASDGSEGTADVLWRDSNQCLFIVQGKYSSPLLPGPIHASALVWLQYRLVRTADGACLVNQQVEAFIYFPSVAVDTIARLASRLTNNILDRNAFEVSLYARMMSQAAEKEPEWIEQLAARMEGVQPQRKVELVHLARGGRPTIQSMQPGDGPEPGETVAQLPISGEFRAFENSLQQLNEHVPLLSPEPSRSPSYGKRLGADLQPVTIRAQQGGDGVGRDHEKRPQPERVAVKSEENDKRPGSPSGQDRSQRPIVAELTPMPVSLIFPDSAWDAASHQKATSAAGTVSGSAPAELSAGMSTYEQVARRKADRDAGRLRMTPVSTGSSKDQATPLILSGSAASVSLSFAKPAATGTTVSP